VFNVIRVCQPSGVLSGFLAHEATLVRNILGDFFSIVTLSVFCLVFGLIVALHSCFQLALVVLGCMPLVIVSVVLARRVGLLCML
jgi:ABC-type transport system involved in cytochrome bd biosynthesis fused ATPase/permease subunit